ncbi:hypothetical protein [Halegenticoccus tardaugens]|uniref:hypothetical protein n=1 Tax=Halegenticoccus tardaugens TaxID=2071624 RepID=UPI00100C0E8A|nr:hypothetical protein [Halegenticoccus tardaugens]
MGGLKKGTGSLNFEEEETDNEHENTSEQESNSITESQTHSADTLAESATENNEHELAPPQDQDLDSEPRAMATADTAPSPAADTTPQAPNFDIDNLPYLVQRQMRGASVNADRTNQLLLEVRPFVKDDEDTFLDDLRDLVDGPVYKGDAREAAMVVAQENPELVAKKLSEWGIEYLDK